MIAGFVAPDNIPANTSILCGGAESVLGRDSSREVPRSVYSHFRSGRPLDGSKQCFLGFIAE
jgi:hypothetical protein